MINIHVGPQTPSEQGAYAVAQAVKRNYVLVQVSSSSFAKQCRLAIPTSAALQLAGALMGAAEFVAKRSWDNPGGTFLSGSGDCPWTISVGRAQSISVTLRHVEDDMPTADHAAEVEMTSTDAANMADLLITAAQKHVKDHLAWMWRV